MVICWKFSTRDRRTLLIAGDEAVTSSSVRPRDMTANHIRLECAGHAPASSPLRLGRSSSSKAANCREVIVADAQKDCNPPTAAERAHRLNVSFRGAAIIG
jgi:hypothetical protein